MLEEKKTYEETCAALTWDIPEYFNIGVDICDRWAEADPDRIALIDVEENGDFEEYSYADLKAMSNQLANALAKLGVERKDNEIGDRVGVLLPQCVETAIAHIAVTKMACVSIPLFTLFGQEALLHRLRDSSAKVVITNTEGAAKIASIRDKLPELKHVFSVDGADANAENFHDFYQGESTEFTPVKTHSEDAALLIYTSGTTGNPKGALQAHRTLLGHLPGVEMSHNFLPHEGDKFWTPADWAWIGGLLDVLMPALHHGIPTVAYRFSKFNNVAALELIKKHNIRNAFLPPTALKMMRLVPDAEKFGIKMRSVASGGETLGTELIEWGEKALGTTINEFYGQTECNMIVAACSAQEYPSPGLMGRAAPGFVVDVIDAETGEIKKAGEEGAIAVQVPNPVMFIEYWNKPEATAEKTKKFGDIEWLFLGDRGVREEDGRLRFVGRDDDVICSGGYRIGPAEIEYCLISHPAVQLAGAVGKPDEIRGELVTAYVTLTDGYNESPELADEIAQYVKSRLAAHEYPREVRFIDAMPMTTTGKIIRGDLRKMATSENN
ncbi:AMP-binding protein [Cocleimonas sp. KMM 6892]|uniref:AMP-binding protein n=1 Tax=unclassified Cocleimonas TaxID=2639732 RepID=UPI002DBCB761|nr:MULTISPECIES: AMP-binding protein [unclassified Cocleimonas]MEB8433019.1 AMP-binding protein [Cocleimonas sp. KMM 6892]MEC4716000.1 AMP-binding protein [Cocleimonas sp. KMM 6895]MEC4745461.1 AMP-binding protein [Cocleimonas sp. KMM 6896]